MMDDDDNDWTNDYIDDRDNAAGAAVDADGFVLRSNPSQHQVSISNQVTHSPTHPLTCALFKLASITDRALYPSIDSHTHPPTYTYTPQHTPIHPHTHTYTLYTPHTHTVK